MKRIKYEDFFLLLNEWKDIIDGAGAALIERDRAKSKIDIIISELKKPKEERNFDIVESSINELKKEKGIRKYVESYSEIIIELLKQ